MKFKLYPITIISVLLICIVTLSNCSPDDGITPDDPGCQNETKYYYLTDKDKSYIPYTGFDTIKMRNQAGDTLYFVGQGKQPFTTSEFVLHNNPACGNKGVTKIYEAYFINFINGLNDTLLFTVRLEKDEFQINYKGAIFISDYTHIGNRNFGFVTTYDTMSINNIIYKNVTQFEDNTEARVSLFMNRDFGVLKITDENMLPIISKLN